MDCDAFLPSLLSLCADTRPDQEASRTELQVLPLPDARSATLSSLALLADGKPASAALRAGSQRQRQALTVNGSVACGRGRTFLARSNRSRGL